MTRISKNDVEQTSEMLQSWFTIVRFITFMGHEHNKNIYHNS